jgi:hypothetical protein
VLVFPPNVSSICINFNITDDTIALEPPEEFILELLKPDDPQLLLLQINSTRIIIVDDDGILNHTGMLILLLASSLAPFRQFFICSSFLACLEKTRSHGDEAVP